MGKAQSALALTRPHICLAAVIGFLLAPCTSRGQGCCTPGSSPLGGISGGALRPGAIEVGLAAEAFALRQGYEGRRRVQDPARRESRVLSTTAYARVGLSRRLALILQVPFEYRERTAPAIPETRQPGQDFSNAAPGDLGSILMVQILPLFPPGPFALNLGLGVKWPTGPDDNTQDGLRLPVELQTGTGSTDPLFALAAYHLWSWGSVSTNAVLRAASRGRSGYRYGEEVNYAVTALWSLGTTWQLGPEVRGRSAARDDFRDSRRENTGGSRVTVGPRVVYSFTGIPLVVEGSFMIPLWQNMNGLQLGVSEGATLGLRWPVL